MNRRTFFTSLATLGASPALGVAPVAPQFWGPSLVDMIPKDQHFVGARMFCCPKCGRELKGADLPTHTVDLLRRNPDVLPPWCIECIERKPTHWRPNPEELARQLREFETNLRAAVERA